MSTHVHSCPECYEDVSCADACDTEPDLGTTVAGLLRGAHSFCESCSPHDPPWAWDDPHALVNRRAWHQAEIARIDARLRELDGRATAGATLVRVAEVGLGKL